ncbi:MAG: addiction module protein [Rhodomicrobium sp.]
MDPREIPAPRSNSLRGIVPSSHLRMTLALAIFFDMANIDNIVEILRLPVAERLALSAALWESLAGAPDAVPVPDWHLEILAERLAEDDGPSHSWAEVRRQIDSGEFLRILNREGR